MNNGGVSCVFEGGEKKGQNFKTTGARTGGGRHGERVFSTGWKVNPEKESFF